MSVPAEGVDDQEVPNHARDADGENHRANGVVGVVGHIHGGEWACCLGHHRHLQDRAQNDKRT